MSKDWNGNVASNVVTNGFANLSQHEREANDYYATDPIAAEWLLKLESLENIWEPACGEGHLAKVFEREGILGRSSDLINRGYGQQLDFLEQKEIWHGDIVTNPPYKFAQEFVEKSLSLVDDGNLVAMFLPVRYLEGKKRRLMFESMPPKTVYVSSSRIKAAMNGDFEAVKSSAVTYTWIVWKKGYEGPTTLRWFN